MMPFAFWQQAGAAVFDPATLALTAWWRADYAGAPWLSEASAASAGGIELDVGDAPTTGAAQNGLVPADFNGSADYLTHTAVNVDSFCSASAWTMVCLFRADTSAAYGADEYDNRSLIASTGAAAAAIGMAHSNDGVSVWHNDGVGWPGVTVSCGTGAYHLARAKYDGTNIKLSIDSGAYSSAAASDATELATETLVVGVDWSLAQFFDGRILEIMLAATALSDGDLDNIKSYINARYALAL